MLYYLKDNSENILENENIIEITPEQAQFLLEKHPKKEKEKRNENEGKEKRKKGKEKDKKGKENKEKNSKKDSEKVFQETIQFNRNTYQVLSESEMLGQRLDYFLDGLNENTKNSNNLFNLVNSIEKGFD